MSKGQLSKRVALAAAVIGLTVCAGLPADAALREVGVRVDLTLQPLYTGSEATWNFDIGGYALVTLGGGWGLRASAGFDVLHSGPYLGLGILRAVASHLMVEGDLTMQWSGLQSPATMASVGARFAGAQPGGLAYQIGAFPLSWTLASAAGAPATFSFSPNLTLGGGFMLATGLEFMESITFTFLPAPAAARPVLPLGPGWMLATRLTSNFGMNFAAP